MFDCNVKGSVIKSSQQRKKNSDVSSRRPVLCSECVQYLFWINPQGRQRKTRHTTSDYLMGLLCSMSFAFEKEPDLQHPFHPWQRTTAIHDYYYYCTGIQKHCSQCHVEVDATEPWHCSIQTSILVNPTITCQCLI